MTEILPNGADPLSYRLKQTWNPARGDNKVETWDGPVAEVTAKYDGLRANPRQENNISGLAMDVTNGRGYVEVVYATIPDPNYKGVQELAVVDVVRSIYINEYFTPLTVDEINDVRKTFEDKASADPSWNVLQDILFGHLMRGQESYLETAYIFRQTFRTNAIDIIQKSAASPNRAFTSLPVDLSEEMKALIDNLPDGEWLKRPTKVTYIGPEGFDVSLEYQWAPEWSIIYGGSFDGL